MRIDSAKSAQVKHVAALQKKARTRREEGCFVVEGIRMVAEAPADRLEAVYAVSYTHLDVYKRQLQGSMQDLCIQSQ